ncbi:SWIM zinc finger domain-containing protein [Chryseobacterium indologenes]|uniref:SWIM zinc finger family protein n=1 Tax=Chryseobacterium TaxID=59732 RepID=UPI001625A5C7|nr:MULTISPECIES: SWIM zinc finger family protein [Chryseobacterium]MDM1556282.1 SWIM zinc finger family protein [Chryseobacterium indologenes]WET48832.1 SWIM zinc finger domain-containing protein [Chryseobacterium indologenes]
MEDMLTYNYSRSSSFVKKDTLEELFLAQYSEVRKNTDVPCFFWGNVGQPFILARCLITLSNIVKSSFSLSPFQMALLKDPIVTAGNERLRFEGFSHCAGVYARVDVLPEGLDGEFLENGTTNVDFNQPMITALGSIRPNEKIMLSVGEKEVGLYKEEKKVVERKVPLPVKWIKGLGTVQIYLSESEKQHTFNKIQTQQLFRGMPKGVVKSDYYLIVRGNKPMFSPVKSADAVCIGGLHRLRLLEPLLPYIDCMQVFSHPNMQSTTWQLYMGNIRFSFSLSRESWRGFSGEGAVLNSLTTEVSDEWIDALDKYAYANQSFNATVLALEENLSLSRTENLTGRLAAMGLLGYDLDENEFFYRRLPFKLSRILGLNPRMKNAEKLIEDGKVEILNNTKERTEARVEGTGVHHTVILEEEKERCTCEWFSKYQGERGPCKHVLAVKKLVNIQ